ncbi:hypothetical protein [Kitasatospora sp. NPDC096140]|uniref:hypothetical protein n=1 Tax=Kitasatospora sp. NPDC096140 TaxID=3155425 RepID=UPI00332A8DBF
MGTSDGPAGRLGRYLNSARNWAGLGGAAVGVGLHEFGLGGGLWPGVAAALYGVGALVAPGPKAGPPDEPPEGPPHAGGGGSDPGRESGAGSGSGTGSGSGSGAGSGSGSGAAAHSVSVSGPSAAVVPEGPPTPPPPLPDPELEALAAYLDTVPLPPSAGVDDLVAALRVAGPGPVAERIVRHRLPLAVAGYLRARTWQPWVGPDAPDPAAELGREVVLLTTDLA